MGIQTNEQGYITDYYAEDFIEYLEVGHKQFKIVCTPANTGWIEEEAIKRNYKRKTSQQDPVHRDIYHVVFEKDG